MTAWPDGLWNKLEVIVKRETFSGANEEFNSFKTVVLKASVYDIEAVVVHAKMIWKFLVCFAEKKVQYRLHIAKIIEKLAAVPSWKAAYEACAPELSTTVSRLHKDIQVALGVAPTDLPPAPPPEKTAATAPAPPSEKTPEETRPRVSTLITNDPTDDPKARVSILPLMGSGIKWPDWNSLEAIVLMDGYATADDEFVELWTAVSVATNEDLAGQSEKSGLVWKFMAGFNSNNQGCAPQISEVVSKLLVAPGWQAAFRAELDEASAAALAELGDPSKVGKIAEPTEADLLALKMSSVPSVQRLPSRKDSLDALELNRRMNDLAKPAAAPIPGDSAPAQRVKPYVLRARQLEDAHPIIAHYCRRYAIELLIQERIAGRFDAGSDTLLYAELADAEEKQKSLELSDGRKTMEEFAIRAYDNANLADATGPLNSSTALQLYVSGVFLEVLSQFHPGLHLPPHIAAMVAYSRERAPILKQCLAEGSMPEPPNPPAAFVVTAAPAMPPVAPAAPPVAPVAPPVVPPAPRVAPAAPPVVAPVVPAPSPAPVAATIPGLPAIPPGLSRAKRQTEARKLTNEAKKSIDVDDTEQASKLIREALAYLDGI